MHMYTLQNLGTQYMASRRPVRCISSVLAILDGPVGPSSIKISNTYRRSHLHLCVQDMLFGTTLSCVGPIKHTNAAQPSLCPLLLHPGFTLKLSTFLTPTAHFTAPPLSLRHRECLTQPLIGITSLTPTFKLPTPSPTPFSNTQYRQRALPTEHAHPAPPHLGIFAPFPSPHPMPPEERHNFLNFSLH
ncbi:hypothetical protein EDB83DRAFT_2334672 [Lactarius deliciosus]|nr:hypothetical protein EDB83DRAFT_2334672 [Lactarius deliciosus]